MNVQVIVTHRGGARLLLGGHLEQDHGGARAVVGIDEGELHSVQAVLLEGKAELQFHC